MVGVILGVVVLAISIGFVVLMMVTEWSEPSGASQPLPLAESMGAGPAPRRGKRKAAPRKKAKSPAKKK